MVAPLNPIVPISGAQLTQTVLVGVVPLLKVQNYVVTETFKTATIAAGPFVQMVGPMSKVVAIDALLVGTERLLRPLLEALALNTVPGLSGVLATAESLLGIPVVSKNFIHLDMQVTQLKFTQDNQNRDTLSLHLELTNVPRAKVLGGFLPGVDIALASTAAFF
jgi:hypothetical protein